MRKTKILSILLVLILLSIGNVLAKDLQWQIGLGFNSQLSPNNRINALSIKYWPNSGLCFQGILGFQMTDIQDEIDLGGKVLFNLKKEQNMNVYAGGGLGFANIDPDNGGSDTAVTLGGILGVEYFFSGLPNLGFSTELGLVFLDYDNFDSVGFDADTFLTAGIHYYFSGKRGPKKTP